MAVDWARLRGRRLLVLTVDHRLNPESASWTRRAGDQARALGCAWRGLVWDAPVPGTGLPAAARAARHALIAGAAREAGASVVLMAHTLDDAVEADLMRAEGTPIGRVREWSPSPVWPEGREVQLFRPCWTSPAPTCGPCSSRAVWTGSRTRPTPISGSPGRGCDHVSLSRRVEDGSHAIRRRA
jgi:tRNA(Ile)-lysidine synthase TilS/MesJ